MDGAWWLRSRDLTRELSALADVLDPLWGRITHIAVNPRHWPILRARSSSTPMWKVGWFSPEQDPHRAYRCPLGRPADGRREHEHRAADDHDRPRDGGTGRRHVLVVRGHHRPARADRWWGRVRRDHLPRPP
ncbi:DUF5994 family protein [Streptomyces lomondensis]|uniref:DUF5994 family protein n=1 Tax=Streptomyces lomondensis TaxID=68229 RepID=UPI001E607843|nr:DUF5994 family protein [Streptomyces lomondensis]MCF0077754.1 DUF5994 family protein [Streptomyces lomondensis]